MVDELDGGTLTVVSETVSNHHVELVVVVFNGEDHGHGLADFDKAGHFGGPGSFSNLREEGKKMG